MCNEMHVALARELLAVLFKYLYVTIVFHYVLFPVLSFYLRFTFPEKGPSRAAETVHISSVIIKYFRRNIFSKIRPWKSSCFKKKILTLSYADSPENL